MKLTAEAISDALSFINAIKDRELDLRGQKAHALENLGASKDLNDTIDFTDNDIRVLTNFPSLPRLRTLLISNNRVVRIDPTICKFIPHLTSLILTNNSLTELSDLEPLIGFKYLKYLSLLDNPVSKKKHYRLWVIYRMPNLRVLDFKKVKAKEVQQAKELFQMQNGELSSLANSILEIKSNTFEPGEGIDSASDARAKKAALLQEQNEKLRQNIMKDNPMEDIQRMEKAFKAGRRPGEIRGNDME